MSVPFLFKFRSSVYQTSVEEVSSYDASSQSNFAEGAGFAWQATSRSTGCWTSGHTIKGHYTATGRWISSHYVSGKHDSKAGH